MNRLWIALVFIAFSLKSFAQCDSTTITVQNPTDTLPNITDFLNGYGDGFYQFQGNPNASTGLILSYWDAEKVTFPDVPSYSSKSDGSSAGYSLNGCQALDDDGMGIHCMYLAYSTKECPVGYELNFSTGQGDLNDLQACLDAQPEICEDGLPPNLAGYYGCDRPALKQCGDGSYVRSDTGICSTFCSDYLSCYNYALANSSCAGSQYFEFSYTDPENFSFSCTSIDSNSPDYAGNGGNEDGNPYNDPNTPTSGDGSISDSGSIDPYSLAEILGNELRPDLSNIERAVRDDIDQSKINTETLEGAVNEVETAVRDSIQSGENNTNAITNSIDALGFKLDDISDSLNSGPCDPNQPNYYQCLDTPMGNLPNHSTTGNASTFAESNANFKLRIEISDVVQAFSGMSSLVNLDNAQCAYSGPI